MDNIELYHHGIKGMRWGIRRFQNKNGSLTPAGKKRLSRKERKNLEKAREAAKAKREHEAAKNRAIKSGSASDVLKFKNELTQQQRSEVEARIGWETRMADLSRKEISAGKKKADKMFNTVGDITDYADKAAKAYNTVANIYNAFNKGGKVLPRIDRDVMKGNSDAVKKAKKELEKEMGSKKKRQEQEAQREEKHQERAEKKARENADEYTVVGEGTSRRREKAETIIEVDYRDVKPSSVPAQTRQLGQRYIAGLLEEPKD